MEMTDEEIRFIETARKLKSGRCRELLMVQAETMYRMQEALKREYGLMGLDTPLYADRNPAPMGAAALAAEALNG
jgi:hypothetical protein